jgi:hypothetical protein
MAAKNDQKSEGAEATDVEDADASIVVVPLPKETVARIDARAARRRGGATRVEELHRLLRIGLEAEEKQITS